MPWSIALPDKLPKITYCLRVPFQKSCDGFTGPLSVQPCPSINILHFQYLQHDKNKSAIKPICSHIPVQSKAYDPAESRRSLVAKSDDLFSGRFYGWKRAILRKQTILFYGKIFRKVTFGKRIWSRDSIDENSLWENCCWVEYCCVFFVLVLLSLEANHQYLVFWASSVAWETDYKFWFFEFLFHLIFYHWQN